MNKVIIIKLQPIYFNRIFHFRNKKQAFAQVQKIFQTCMNKQNKNPKIKCIYCQKEATGIIYRPKDQLQNVFSCHGHATNLFIPFKGTVYNKSVLEQSRYRSPQKMSQFSIFYLSDVAEKQKNPQLFFDKLMQNIINEFNEMKKQVMTNYNIMKNMQKNEQALNFHMQGDSAYPYMIINNDEDMLMNTFVNRLLCKYSQQIQKQKRQKILKRRMELSTIISSQNLALSQISGIKLGISLIPSRLIYNSPQNIKSTVQIQKATQTTGQKTRRVSIDYSRTEKRQKISYKYE